MKLKDSKTYINLAKSYAGECQARTRYEFIEYGARNAGYKYLAELIDKVVYNEFNHARMFYTYLQDSEETQIENIDIASGYPSRKNGICSTISALPPKTNSTRQTAFIPSTPKQQEKKVSSASRNCTRISFRSKPATTNFSRSCTNR